ncbi:MAG: metallopeptidase, partial [Oscillospiraceae bacterium]
QCDAEIQGETTLNTGGDIARFLEDFSPKGFGGTDFRPVFQRIAQLRERGEMETVRGLLYLSDGFGEFPAEPPDYETAFIFPKEEQEYAPERNAFLPPWVTRIQLTEEDFTLEEDF